MNLGHTFKFVHELLDKHKIAHALIGGLALACYGSTRATIDLDLLIDVEQKSIVKSLLLENGFDLVHSTEDVLQFSGPGLVDILIAHRPIAKEILITANEGGPEGIKYIQADDLIGLKIQAYVNDPSREFQDKADIQFLICHVKDLDWDKIKKYADLFNEWETINAIKDSNKS